MRGGRQLLTARCTGSEGVARTSSSVSSMVRTYHTYYKAEVLCAEYTVTFQALPAKEVLQPSTSGHTCRLGEIILSKIELGIDPLINQFTCLL